ncbi:MAG: nitrate reductase molybdenum cofactor assembly chaperone [Chloroflexi bacterium]|nr:nitrate reductase molybdenum cofactor assembly chaperone [Chloroflexota bacterium]
MSEELAQAYKLIADLLSYPEEMDVKGLQTTSQEVADGLKPQDPEAADLIRSFARDLGSVTAEYYVEVFELAPQCSLYLGSYGLPEPETCSSLGTSERNQLFMEMANIYRHYGLSLGGKELPDFLPAVVEFLWLTEDREDGEPRGTLIAEFVLPYLPKMRRGLEEIGSPYAKLLRALEALLKLEVSARQESHAKPVG